MPHCSSECAHFVATPVQVRVTLRVVKTNRDLASWLISHRNEIESAMNNRLGTAAPGVSSPEAEALRRFRTYTSSALMRGTLSPPALDGLRVNQRRTEALLLAWIDAAGSLADADVPLLREALNPGRISDTDLDKLSPCFETGSGRTCPASNICSGSWICH